jgi:tetratricopeptide (TPR) repeat protein
LKRQRRSVPIGPGFHVVLAFLVLGAAAFAADKEAPPLNQAATNLPPVVLAFCAAKEQQVNRLAAKLKVEVLPTATNYFDAARKGDWVQAFDLYREVTEFLQNSSASEDQTTLDATTQAAALEVQLALEQFIEGEPKYALAFGNDIVKSLPRGSIYFGGTDPGRGLVTALCASHEKADPFFTLTQRALADGGYLTYLRTMYGGKIYTPTAKESEGAFKEYVDDAQRRLEHDQNFPNESRQIKPGEDVRMNKGKVSVSGHVAVMSINALLAKIIFDRNPDREFFVEESFPLDWMYPHLSPHGLVMKINRKALATISSEVVEKDRKFWLEQERPMIGGWLKPETSVKDVCAFVEKVFVKRDFEGFSGDPSFVRSDHATKMYSKLRSAIGGLYTWRANNAKVQLEKNLMQQEADFAFRQAFALCPSSPEAVFRYINLLLQQGRVDDGLLLAQTAANIDPTNGQVENLIRELNRMKGR